MFNNEPLCERCWFDGWYQHPDRTKRPPLDVVKVAEPEACHACGRPTIAGIFVRVEAGQAPPPPDPDDPSAPDYQAGREQGHHEGYDDGFAAGYDAALRDNGLAIEPELRAPVEDVPLPEGVL